VVDGVLRGGVDEVGRDDEEEDDQWIDPGMPEGEVDPFSKQAPSPPALS
jgi:hypothetical protein